MGRTQPPVQWVPVLFPGDADCKPPPSAEVKIKWGCTYAPPMCLDGFDMDNVYYKEGPPIYIYMCVCICVYIYIHIHTHTHTHIYIYETGCR